MNPVDNDNEKKLSQLMDGEWHEIDPAECVAALCADEALHAKWSRYHIIRDVLKNEPVQADSALASRICSAIQNEQTYSNVTPLGKKQAVRPEVTDAALINTQRRPVSSGSSALDMDADQLPDKSSWINTGVAGFAVAASVALVTVVGLNLVQQQGNPATATQSVASLANTAVPATQALNAPAPSQPSPAPSADEASLPVVEFVANTGPFWMSPESSTRVPNEGRLNMMLSRHIESSPTAAREGVLPYSRLIGYEEESSQRP